MADPETLAVYAARARDYADLVALDSPDAHLTAFLNALPKGARVLDLGCGTGQSAAFMAANGIDVDAIDASPEMAAVALERFGLAVTVAPFDALVALESYDGVFANFSLLHAPKSEMPAHLARVATALKPGGIFHLGLKTGDGEDRDGLGRFYAYYQDAEITALVANAGFSVKSRSFGANAGLSGSVDPWIILLAKKEI